MVSGVWSYHHPYERSLRRILNITVVTHIPTGFVAGPIWRGQRFARSWIDWLNSWKCDWASVTGRGSLSSAIKHQIKAELQRRHRLREVWGE